MVDLRLFVGVITVVYGLGFAVPLICWVVGYIGRPAAAGQVVPDSQDLPDKPFMGIVKLSLVFALLASLLSVVQAATSFNAPQTSVLVRSVWWDRLPELRWEARLDNLSAFFVLLAAGFSAVVAVYSFAALQASHYRKQAARIAAVFNLFAWSTLMVIIANDAFLLIAAMEIMTLAFGFLALYKHTAFQDKDAPPDENGEKEKNATLAPQVYLIVSHTSTAFLVLALLLLAIQVHSLSFDALRGAAHAVDANLASVVFVLALIGLGIRAGLTPAHFWVSLVHPASPTTTHALSLGIAIKVAVYLMFRFFFEFLQPQAWWGYAVLLVAAVTAIMNVWYAIASHDLKTALAYHSIENIGIIVVGIGIALIFCGDRDPQHAPIAQAIAALALAASLYHLLNHAVFKGLLYLGTGAIDNLTGQVVEFGKLGGLLKIFPLTSLTFLVGAVSIAGFPPFNGFVSEWLTLQAALNGLAQLKGDLAGLMVIAASLILLVGSFAMTAFCFVKIAGVVLLGKPRQPDAPWVQQWLARKKPWDVPRPMTACLVLMAALCLALGVLPGWVIYQLSGVVKTITGIDWPVPWSLTELHIALAPQAEVSLDTFSPLMVSAVTAAVVIAALRPMNRRGAVRVPPETWNGGTPYAQTTMQYTGAGLSFLLRDSISAVASSPATENDYLPSRLTLSDSEAYPQAVVEVFRERYNRLADWVVTRSERFGLYLHNRDLGRYLLYILIANVVVMVLFLLVRGLL